MPGDSGEWTVATNRRHDRKKPPSKRKMTEEERRAYEEKEEKKLVAQRQKALAAAASLSSGSSSERPAPAAAPAKSSSPATAPAAAAPETKPATERPQREKRRPFIRCVLIVSSEAEKNELTTALTGRIFDVCAVLFHPSEIAKFPSGGATPVASVEEAVAAMEKAECVIAVAAGYCKKSPRMNPKVEEVVNHVLGAGYLVEVISVDSKIPRRKKGVEDEPFKLVFDLSKESKKELIHVLGLSATDDVLKRYVEAGLVAEGETVSTEKKCAIDVFPEFLHSSVTTYHGKDYVEGCKKADELVQKITYLISYVKQPFYAFKMEFFAKPQSQEQKRTTIGKEDKGTGEEKRIIYTIGADGSAPIADEAAAQLGDHRSRRLQIVVNKYRDALFEFVPEKEKMIVTFNRMMIAQPATIDNPLVELLLPEKEAQDAVIARLEARVESEGKDE